MDMTCQLGQMHTIYNQATVTIVAAAGESSSYGLPGVGQCSRKIPNKISLNGTTWKPYTNLLGFQLGNSKWLTRGWTYQEAVFSRRCVIFADDQVFFQCGTMSCAEELMEDFDNCIIDFEHRGRMFECISDKDKGLSQSTLRSSTFMADLKAFSEREMTYDSDVLRAMDGVFSFYAQLQPPVEQYWGLPLRWVGCAISAFDQEDAIHSTARSKHHDVVGAFLWAMLWEPEWRNTEVIETGLNKRNGFPTWSWCAWKSEVRWNFLSNMKNLEDSFTVPLFAETTTGGLVEVDDEFAQSLTSSQSFSALGLTYILRITTLAFDVSFVETEPYRFSGNWNDGNSFATRERGQHWVAKDDGHDGGTWTHFIVQKAIGSPDRGLFWSLSLTHGGETRCSDLSFVADAMDPKPMILRCIVISHDCGMIVQSSKGISKRVGLLRFRGEFFDNGRLRIRKGGGMDPSTRWQWVKLVESRDLRDHFPGVLRTIRLG
ncbi:uncharacterized protein B0J16DRAFT_388872 [Fusarium flagelliforme]|uniref:Heterokaryon incompatibility domain-containing protein n=1 Tax=Fusarium flagelliforme TaxID=2675880 RepID=A0A395MG72_9HYPO|nr:uncharacterized protein B0J16DRAFT_388872 [Fusarium flagelliforme]KAH7175045.1 hypothetical protein B0J16DRAFT_388872 [Fusarium flagelliforme]RFN46918.1 hypothetical protein FIE12Z_8851 [Fusarium flagelliforme]